jgi:hypothetical protein
VTAVGRERENSDTPEIARKKWLFFVSGGEFLLHLYYICEVGH